MAEARKGDQVRIHYTGRLDDGSVFDSSVGREPLEFRIGSGMVIPGFDRAVTGLQVGESRTAVIPPEDAYGAVRDELRIQVDRGQLPPEVAPTVGLELQMTTGGGQVVPVRIDVVTDTHVTLDANHPLAGKQLTFEVELVSIAPA
jgi:peptidylprolyl isomerase